MARVISADGTSIAYQRNGSGPAVILIGGGLDDGSENAPLAEELAKHFTVYSFARRGRGDSGLTQPYAVQREIEDIAALIEEAGGIAHLFGVSSGGMFALEAAAAGLAIGRIAVYEVPYDTADDALQRAQEYREQLDGALVRGRHADAVGLFMRLAGSSEQNVAGRDEFAVLARAGGSRSHLGLRRGPVRAATDRSLGDDHTAHTGGHGRQQRLLRAGRR